MTCKNKDCFVYVKGTIEHVFFSFVCFFWYCTCDIKKNSTIAAVNGSAYGFRLGTRRNMARLNVP